MYKKYGTADFGVGYINDEYVLLGIDEFKYGDNELVKKISFKMWTNEENGEDLYEYKDYLVNLTELKREYLKDYYNVE